MVAPLVPIEGFLNKVERAKLAYALKNRRLWLTFRHQGKGSARANARYVQRPEKYRYTKRKEYVAMLLSKRHQITMS